MDVILNHFQIDVAIGYIDQTITGHRPQANHLNAYATMTSDSLINVADRYIDLDTVKEDIQKNQRPYTYRPLSVIGVGLESDALE